MKYPYPALFIAHGNPMNTLEDNVNSRAWSDWGKRMPKPRAILVISAHWETTGIAVTSAPNLRTIHDFAGFPERLSKFTYPALGEPDLARRVADLLAPEPVFLDAERGLDHGAWSVLARLCPTGAVPVVQLSLDTRRNVAAHYELARRLRPLRDEDILILGSGNIVHNLRRMDWQRREGGYTWADRFNNRMRRHLQEQNHAGLCDLESDDAHLAVPSAEHYLPLLYVAAVQDPGEYVSILNDHIEYGSISMLSAWVGHMKGAR